VADTDVLWGGVSTSLTLDPIAWRLSADVKVTSGEVSRQYTVVLDEVRELRASRAVPLPWQYAELSEVHVSSTATDGLAVEFVLWGDDTVSATCSRVSVTPVD
jgi:hypothetical protein